MSAAGSHRPTKLTIATILYDRDDPVQATLDAAQSIADEVLVVDASPDQASASDLPDQPSFADDPSAARNHLLDSATGDWVLWLEAGETLSLDALDSIRLFVDQQAQPQVVYRMMVETPPAANHVASERKAQVRLMPRLDSLRFRGRVRESIDESVAQAGLEMQQLSMTIQRSAAVHDEPTLRRKAQLELKRAEMQIAIEGETGLTTRVVADSLSTLGAMAEAARHYRRALELAERGSTSMLEAYYGLLTTYDDQPSEKEIQLAVCLEALDVFPVDAQLLCAMGSYMLAQNRPDLATRSYMLAVEHGTVDPCSWHVSEIGPVSVACLALTLQLQQQDDQAREVLEAALESYPDSLRLRRQLLNLHIKHGRNAEAEAQFSQLPTDLPHRQALHSAVRGALFAAVKDWEAALPQLRAAYQSGCRDPLCLRWLSVACLSTGIVAEAEPILREWDSLEPGNSEVLSYLAAASQLRQSPAPAPATQRPAPAGNLRFDSSSPSLAPVPTPAPGIVDSPFGGRGAGVPGSITPTS